MDDLGDRITELGLRPSLADFTEIRSHLRASIERGLAEHGSQVAMLATFVRPPDASLAGEAIAIDAGGTRLRAARVVLRSGAAPEVLATAETFLPGSAGRPPCSRAVFFDAHADLVARLRAPAGLPIGYCFSFPARPALDGDATLLRWTKEVTVEGMVGELVGAGLREALAASGYSAGSIVVLNDTITVLEAGAYAAGRGERTLGLIVGTGTNIGAFFPAAAIPKIAGEVASTPWASGALAVNFESGAYATSLGSIDVAVDAASELPGAQRFEKCVSGAYLGRVLAEASRRLGLGEVDGRSSAIVSSMAAGADGPQRTLARAILDRSADLVAVAIRAACDVLEAASPSRAEHPARLVCAEGSLIERAPGYADRLASSLATLFPGERAPIELSLTHGSTQPGASLAALGRGA